MAISRRALLQGQVGDDVAHISSLVVHCRPDSMQAAIEKISAMPEAEVPESSDQGKLVVLLETANESIIMQRISAIEDIPGVINVVLVYHQIDNETGLTP